ncbi:MAG: hypothetical protein J6O53_03410 [Eubacterium sp.]|nr:hypothetical protein [Eubacterium sp.]
MVNSQIYYNKGVDKIELEKKTATGVRLLDGTFVSADYVIPTVDSHLLFNRFL